MPNFSIGWWSGDCGYWILVWEHLCFYFVFQKSKQYLDACFGSLSCWKVNLWQYSEYYMELHDLLKYRNKFSYPLFVQLVSNLQISTFKIIRNHNVTTHISQCDLNSFRLDVVRSFHLAYWSLFVKKNSNLDWVENNFSHSLSVQNRRSLANWRRFVLLISRSS